MAFFDNWGNKATEATAKAMQKAQELSEVARLNSLISDEEKKASNAYYQIGRLYVSLHSADNEEAFAGLVAAALDSEYKMEDLRRQIEAVKGVQRCAACGAEVAKGMAFCSACGNPMPKVELEPQGDKVQCQACGAMVQKGMRFCTSCGKPMSQAAPAVQYPANQTYADAQYQNIQPYAQPQPYAASQQQYAAGQYPAQVYPAAAQPYVQEKVCPNCGAQLEADAVFCTECGTKV